MTRILCPRCNDHEYTPMNEPYDQEAPYPAMSRLVNVYICSWCGEDEGMLDLEGQPPIPPDEWPVK
jgi:hypothetical protein